MLADDKCLHPPKHNRRAMLFDRRTLAGKTKATHQFLKSLRAVSMIATLAIIGCAFASSETPTHDSNSACASCHRAIYERYRHTPMANGSGPAVDGFTPADFTHQASGIHYRIYEDGGKVYLSYDRA